MSKIRVAQVAGPNEPLEIVEREVPQPGAGSKRVYMLVRSKGLADSMSRYLIRRIEQNPAIVLRTNSEIVALEGSSHLDRVRWRDNQAGSIETHDIRYVLLMTGAVPGTQWLDGCVAFDANGFIKTGPDLSQDDLTAAHWPRARPPHLLETSLPGVFAVGDVRGGNIKRVASAVGEGSIAISFVHQVLSEREVNDDARSNLRSYRGCHDRQAGETPGVR